MARPFVAGEGKQGEYWVVRLLLTLLSLLYLRENEGLKSGVCLLREEEDGRKGACLGASLGYVLHEAYLFCSWFLENPRNWELGKIGDLECVIENGRGVVYDCIRIVDYVVFWDEVRLNPTKGVSPLPRLMPQAVFSLFIQGSKKVPGGLASRREET